MSQKTGIKLIVNLDLPTIQPLQQILVPNNNVSSDIVWSLQMKEVFSDFNKLKSQHLASLIRSVHGTLANLQSMVRFYLRLEQRPALTQAQTQ